MKKIVSMLIAAILLLSGCSSATLDGAGKELEDTIANISDSDNKYVQMVKGGYKVDNPELTYEDAFSAFFGTPRWKYFEGEDGQDVVEFTGDCTYRDVVVKARIQFVVDEENGTFEATYLAFNEVPQDDLTLNAVITKAFDEAKAVGAGSSWNKVTDTTGQVLFRGISMQDMFKMSVDDIIATLGEPDEYAEDYIQYGSYGENVFPTSMYFSSSFAYIDGLLGDSELFTFNGQCLKQELDTLIDILGDDFYCLGGTAYEWTYQWTIGDFDFIFNISRDDDMSYSIEVYKTDTDVPGNDDIYSDDGNYYYAPTLDSDLCGRWRELTGSAWITLDEYGNASTNMYINSTVTIGNPEYAVWEAAYGQLKVTGTYKFDIKYRLSHEKVRDWEAEREANDGTIKLVDGRETIWMYDAEYVRHEGTPEGTGIIGEWCIAFRGADSTPQYIFNSDGTGFTRCTDPMTWTADDEMIYTHYQLSRVWDYSVLGDTLLLFFPEGAKTFIRVSN